MSDINKRGLVEDNKLEYAHTEDHGPSTPPEEKYDAKHDIERRHSRGVQAINMNTSAK